MYRVLTPVLSLLVLLLCSSALAAERSRGVVYDFTARWCGPCQQVAPVVEKLEREGLPIRKIDIDQHKELANRYQIDRVPTFVLVVDGKEVDRTTGYMTEADLRRMVDRIPKEAPQRVDEAIGGQVLVDLGSSAEIAPGQAGNWTAPTRNGDATAAADAGLVRPASDSRQEELQAAEDAQPAGIRKLWPFGRTADAEPPTVRGNDASLAYAEAPAATPGRVPVGDPMAASVRIRVVINGGINLGSGTIIASRTGHTHILTCGHIFRGFNDEAKIEVDLFEQGRSQMHVARLMKYDLDADIGLVVVPTDKAFPAAPVGPAESAPKMGEPVAAIGCGGGDDPSREQLRITAIDKYEGPNNIECTGVPIRGRSGGGLFNRNGEAIGVCIAADTKGQRGLYAGLFALHKLLDECGLSELYQPASPAPVEPAAPVASAPRENDAVPGPAAALAQGAPAKTEPNRQPQPLPERSAAPVDIQAGNAEVVVIIRDKSKPRAENRVVIIHDASPKFFSYLSGELNEPVPPASQAGHQEPDRGSDSAAPLASRPEGQLPLGGVEREVPLEMPGRSLRASSGSPSGVAPISHPLGSKALLVPTGFSRPLAPRPYVRSVESRNPSGP